MMSGVDDRVTWLRAQLDDDERVAREAGDDALRWRYEGADRHLVDEFRTLAIAPYDGTLHEAEHIARWDPARVLAEVDAKRRMLDLHAPEPSHYVDGRYVSGEPGDPQCAYCAELCHSRSGLGCDTPDAPWPCPTVQLLALPFADRPGWRDEWRP